MSRSAFAARFKVLVGESPMQYITRWRMNLAVTWLKQDNVSLGELANRLGYQSEAAFSRAFKRITGISPVSPHILFTEHTSAFQLMPQARQTNVAELGCSPWIFPDAIAPLSARDAPGQRAPQ